MKFAEQALILLDLPTNSNLSRRLDRFPDIESMVNSSFEETILPVERLEIPTSTESFTVASRMGRVNYDEQAKAEALVTALEKIRSNNSRRGSNGGRVLRRT